MPDGRHVGPAHEVAVALVPVGVLVARQRRHVDVDRQQVVARLDVVGQHVLAEEVPGDALAHEPTLQVGEHDEHRVDLVVGDQPVERLDVESSACGGHGHPSRCRLILPNFSLGQARMRSPVGSQMGSFTTVAPIQSPNTSISTRRPRSAEAAGRYANAIDCSTRKP